MGMGADGQWRARSSIPLRAGADLIAGRAGGSGTPKVGRLKSVRGAAAAGAEGATAIGIMEEKPMGLRSAASANFSFSRMQSGQT